MSTVSVLFFASFFFRCLSVLFFASFFFRCLSVLFFASFFFRCLSVLFFASFFFGCLSVLFFASFFFRCLSVFLHPTRRLFWSKALVYCGFLEFHRTVEYISQDLFYFVNHTNSYSLVPRILFNQNSNNTIPYVSNTRKRTLGPKEDNEVK